MKNRLLLFFSLIGWLSVCSFADAADPKDVIRDKSPDGKFALRVSKDEDGGSAAIIDLKEKGEVVPLEIYQNYTEGAHLVWSKDSQRVAYFEPDRRGGETTVYFRSGDKFQGVGLPELPECEIAAVKGETFVKTIESTTKPQRWLSSGALLLKVHSGELMEKGAGGDQIERSCSLDVAIAFDANHKATVQSGKPVKSR